MPSHSHRRFLQGSVTDELSGGSISHETCHRSPCRSTLNARRLESRVLCCCYSLPARHTPESARGPPLDKMPLAALRVSRRHDRQSIRTGMWLVHRGFVPVFAFSHPACPRLLLALWWPLPCSLTAQTVSLVHRGLVSVFAFCQQACPRLLFALWWPLPRINGHDIQCKRRSHCRLPSG